MKIVENERNLSKKDSKMGGEVRDVQGGLETFSLGKERVNAL
jgi:hypothetical protein